jgi:hypothetical protein
MGNLIFGTAIISDDVGVGVPPADPVPVVAANRIAGPLICTGDVPPPTNDGLANKVAGPELGQCSGL